MDDLISRKALLAEYDRVHIGEPGKARKLIEDAPAVQQWISVKDRLPEYGQPVLVCDAREDYVGMAVLQPAKHFVFSKSEDYWDWDRMECNLDEFTHWQYLPQPPKGE